MHDYFSDDELWDYLHALDVSVLPYRFGTHSGWLEACHDLGTTVVAPTCGFYAEQRPCLTLRPRRPRRSTPRRWRRRSARAVDAAAALAATVGASGMRERRDLARPTSGSTRALLDGERLARIALIAVARAPRSPSRSPAAWRR